MKRRKKRKFSWYVSWVFSLAVILSLTSALVLSLPIWRLSKTEIHGADLIFKNKIINVAKIPFGENIFFVGLKDIEQRIKSIIQIKSVKIFKKFPDTLIVRIEERVPFALLVVENRTVLIDDEGYIIATQGEASYFKMPDVSRFPVVRGIKRKDLIGGKRLNFRDKFFILKALKLLSGFISPESLQLKIGNLDNIVVFVEDVLRLELGDAKQIEKKIAVFGAILKEIEGKWEKIEYINIGVPDCPVVKYKA